MVGYIIATWCVLWSMLHWSPITISNSDVGWPGAFVDTIMASARTLAEYLLLDMTMLRKNKDEYLVIDYYHHQWASCQMRKIAGAHAPGMPGTFSPSPQVSDPDMHHGTCVTHVPWCMPGSLTSGFLLNRRRGKTFPAFPAHAQPAILCVW